MRLHRPDDVRPVYYIPLPGREKVCDLTTLCRTCHELAEVNKRVRRAA